MNKKVSILNRKAKYEYTFIRTLSAGMQLTGSEVKAIRDSRVSFVDSYCIFNNGELFLKSLNISAPAKGVSHEPTRERKLLLKRKELNKLERDLDTGITIIPYHIYENDRGILKIEIALAKGKKLYDKKDSIKERDIKKQIEKDLL